VYKDFMSYLYKIIPLSALMLWSAVISAAVAPISDNKQVMIEQIQSWASATVGVSPEAVVVNSLDRRLQVPHCDEPFILSFPFNDSRSVRVICEHSGWNILTTVTINRDPEGLYFSRELAAGHQLTGEDIDLLGSNADQSALRNEREQYLGFILNTSVQKGQPFRPSLIDQAVTVFEARSDLSSGKILSMADVAMVARSSSHRISGRAVTQNMVVGAKLSRDLSAGSALQVSDLLLRNQVLSAREPIPRGVTLSDANTEMITFYGNLPADAARDLGALSRVITTSQLRPGQPIRFSNLRVLADVVKDDEVRLMVRSGAVSIETTVKALSGGSTGERVQVRNPESGETFSATVTGVRTATLP